MHCYTTLAAWEVEMVVEQEVQRDVVKERGVALKVVVVMEDTRSVARNLSSRCQSCTAPPLRIRQ